MKCFTTAHTHTHTCTHIHSRTSLICFSGYWKHIVDLYHCACMYVSTVRKKSITLPRFYISVILRNIYSSLMYTASWQSCAYFQLSRISLKHKIISDSMFPLQYFNKQCLPNWHFLFRWQGTVKSRYQFCQILWLLWLCFKKMRTKENKTATQPGNLKVHLNLNLMEPPRII